MYVVISFKIVMFDLFKEYENMINLIYGEFFFIWLKE